LGEGRSGDQDNPSDSLAISHGDADSDGRRGFEAPCRFAVLKLGAASSAVPIAADAAVRAYLRTLADGIAAPFLEEAR
jgi:hypothetical protein